MILVKPSELPLDTVIEVDNELYIKQVRSYGNLNPVTLWMALECEDCQGAITFAQDQADLSFHAFRIVSLPYAITADLVEAATRGNGVPVDVTISLMLKEHHARN